MNIETASRKLTIELLALDLQACGRCTGTGANLDSAIEICAAVLREANVEVEIHKTVVTSAQQAEQLRFESSPTIRINGRDIALEYRESNCGDCGDICGCEGQVDCRVWVWQGREYTEAPQALIVDAILRAYSQAWEPVPQAKTFRLPDNLRRFFEAATVKAAQADKDCCDRTMCCDESVRGECCGAGAKQEVCGCKG
ncbi:MAG: DUF2703 domain-containing protein [Phycisphaerales bacterium]|nr:DUF2703 domain-containing protein [Phycisphaerales bacterium]